MVALLLMRQWDTAVIKDRCRRCRAMMIESMHVVTWLDSSLAITPHQPLDAFSAVTKGCATLSDLRSIASHAIVGKLSVSSFGSCLDV